MKPTLSVIVPVYNEEEVLHVSYERFDAVLVSLGENYELIYVDDGSTDKTPAMLEGLRGGNSNVKVITLSRNFGHQAAITAGMEYSSGDAVVVIDADLQDPPEVMRQMYAKWREGYDVVYGKRVKRMGETLFKKISARLFYRLLRKMTNVDIPVDTGDFRLIDRKVCDALASLPEQNRFVRGLISWIGFRQTSVEFVREERYAGETKYPLKKMVELSVNGMASFSRKPLRFAYTLGFITILLGLAILISLLFVENYQNWMLPVALIIFLQGFMFITIGILGEYIGRIYDESRGRPNYIVGKTAGFDEKDFILYLHIAQNDIK